MITDKKIKIGLDFHGVISVNPDFFGEFTDLAIARGYEIDIITGGSSKIEKHFLDAWGISYTNFFSLLDSFESQGLVDHLDDGDFHVDPDLWNKKKADYCISNNISIHIDDTELYGQYFITPFCLYSADTQSCRISERVVDFSKSAQTSLMEVENFLRQIN